jgi:hypothetical protein
MSIEELTKAVDEMKAQGQSEEEIAGAYYLLFRDGKIDLEQLEALVNHLGFELSEEFKAMDPEQQKEAGYEVLDEKQEEPRNSADNDEDDEDEENKAMKLLGQDKKEKKEETSKPETDNDEDDEDEEDEEKKAMKFFR